MMRRTLLAAAVALGMAWHAPANAQLATIDLANLEAQARDYLQFLKQYALQGKQYIAEFKTLETVILQLESFVQNPSAHIGMLLSIAGLNSALPISPWTVQSLISGRSQGGALGFLSTLQTISAGSNGVYTCTDASWACQQLKLRASGLAGSQGIAMNELQVMQSHQTVLQGLREQLSTATTPAERDNLMAAIHSEATFVQMENTRMQSTQLLASSQTETQIQQAAEKRAQDADNFLASIPK